MSQHDFNIGNQLFPATRTDLNNALAALASNSSGSAEPSTTYANQWWYETDTNTLKIRNEANSAWISVAVLDQTSNNVLSINTQGLTISNTAVTATGAELNKLSGTSVTSSELDILSGASVTTAELNKLSGANVTTAELNKLSGANVTTAELDILSGANVTTAELNKLSTMTSSTTELNQLDDITRGSIIYGDSVGTARLAKGTDGQVLTATATDINWETPSVSDPAAIISSGGSSPTPSLATGITAGEIRNLIGAGVSDSDTTYSIQDGELSENNFTNADHSKLDGIETGATADQTNAEIRAAVDAATNSNVFTDAHISKLVSIETSATADQTDAEIRAAVEAATDSNVFTDADHTKLDGVASSANNYAHPNHSGEVTSTADGATVISDNVVDEANLKVSNAPVNGYVLTAQSGNVGGLTWAAASSGGGGVGVSQSWQTNTKNGQNTEGEPIMVFSRFNGFGNTASFQVSSDNSTWLTLADSQGYTDSGDSFAGGRTTVAAIIPNNHYWRITGTVASHTGNGGPNINMVLK